MKSKNILTLIFSLFICLLAGVLGSLFTTPSITTWYASLQKPVFNPPNWIFGPVWTILYVLMGVSFYLILKNKHRQKKQATVVFGAQLFLNILWSVLFFGVHSPLYAFIEIIFLWLSIFVSIILFYRINKTASYLLIPYILWVSFASVLNFFIFYLN